jgi:putative aldouronate transport system substrate-binding protein
MKKIVALIMALCMLIALFTACAQSSTTTTTTTAKVTTTAGEETTADDGVVWKRFDGVVLTCFIQHSWYPIDTFTGKIAEQITADTGMSLDLTIAVDGAQLGLMIASGDLPDMIYTDGYLNELSDASLCYDYDELIDTYDVGWEIDPILRGNALITSTDGKIYYVRNHTATTGEWDDAEFAAPMTGVVSVRLDILEKFGNPKLETLADFEAILARVKAEKPCDFGHVTATGYWGIDVWRTSCGVTYLDWTEQDDGTYKWYMNTPKAKEWLRMLNRWTREGYIPMDCWTSNEWPAYDEGKAFSSTQCTQNCDGEAAMKLALANPEWISGAIPPLDYKEVWISSIGWSGTFITRNCSNPEAAINYMEYIFTPYAAQLTQMGREGIDFVKDENGVPKFSEEWLTAIKEGVHNDVFNPWLYFGGRSSVEGPARCAAYPTFMENFEPAYKVIRENFENHPWIKAATPPKDSDELNVMNKIIDATVPNQTTMIMAASDAEFEAAYQAYLDQVKQIGLDQLEAYMSQKIPEFEKNYK